jgi:inner membrane protein YidH
MIPSYSDHAANERTFLAWIRTGLTIMALGFVIERLDLFLATLAPAVRDGALSAAPHVEIHILSIALVGLGILVIAAAAWRFVTTNRAIDAQEVWPFRNTVLPIGMACLVLLAGIAVLVHLLRGV